MAGGGLLVWARAFSCLIRCICEGLAPKCRLSSSSWCVRACVSSEVMMASGSGCPVPRPAARALPSSASMFSMYSCTGMVDKTSDEMRAKITSSSLGSRE